MGVEQARVAGVFLFVEQGIYIAEYKTSRDLTQPHVSEAFGRALRGQASILQRSYSSIWNRGKHQIGIIRDVAQRFRSGGLL
jgi:hypothetical protein